MFEQFATRRHSIDVCIVLLDGEALFHGRPGPRRIRGVCYASCRRKHRAHAWPTKCRRYSLPIHTIKYYLYTNTRRALSSRRRRSSSVIHALGSNPVCICFVAQSSQHMERMCEPTNADSVSNCLRFQMERARRQQRQRRCQRSPPPPSSGGECNAPAVTANAREPFAVGCWLCWRSLTCKSPLGFWARLSNRLLLHTYYTLG